MSHKQCVIPNQEKRFRAILQCTALAGLFLVSGCTVTSLQQVEVDAPAVQQPIRITENTEKGNLIARGFFAYNQDQQVQTQIREHTLVNEEGVFEVEEGAGPNVFIEREGVNVYPFRGNNFTWSVPDWQAGIELELPLSDGASFTGGLGFADGRTTTQLNQQLGLGLFFNVDNWGYRFDFNLAFQQSRYNMEAVQGYQTEWRGGRDREVRFIFIDDNDRYTHPSFGVTLNSKYTDRPINFFFNYTLGRQTFYNVKDHFEIESGGTALRSQILRSLQRPFRRYVFKRQSAWPPAVRIPVDEVHGRTRSDCAFEVFCPVRRAAALIFLFFCCALFRHAFFYPASILYPNIKRDNAKRRKRNANIHHGIPAIQSRHR